jgi:hypothetical protein
MYYLVNVQTSHCIVDHRHRGFIGIAPIASVGLCIKNV